MNKKRRIIIISVIAFVLAVLFLGSALYVSDYYRSDLDSIEAFSYGADVKKTVFDGAVAYGTGDEKTAFIFYPGGKVEYTAYEPLMRLLAENGVLCLLVEMPFNLAVLDMNAAENVKALYPDIDSWYIGGHSLGGSMAASHLGKNADEYDGLVLLGSYSTEDLSETDLSVLSIYGSEDKVMNRDKYEQYKPNLPDGFAEKVIDGGCHAYFGMYGAQDGDGMPTITAEEQIVLTADAVIDFIIGGADAEDN